MRFMSTVCSQPLVFGCLIAFFFFFGCNVTPTVGQFKMPVSYVHQKITQTVSQCFTFHMGNPANATVPPVTCELEAAA